MDDIVLYQKRKKLIKYLIFGVYSMLILIFIIFVGIYYPSNVIIFVGATGALISFLYSGVIIYRFFRPKAIFTINSNGIIDNSTFPRIGEIPWEDIERFYIAKVYRKTSIYVQVTDSKKILSHFSFLKSLFIRINTPKDYEPVGISLSDTDADLNDIYLLLEDRLSRYRKQQGDR